MTHTNKSEVTTSILLPQSMDAERSVLGAMLLDANAASVGCEILNIEDFYKGIHQKIFEKILVNFNRGIPSDLVTLTEALSGDDMLKEAGGAYYLSELVDQVPTSANVSHYAEIVKEKATRRRLISTCAQISRESYSPENEASDLLDHAQQSIFEIAQEKQTGDFVHIGSLINDTIDTINHLYERKTDLTGIISGFKDLDVMTSGLQRSDLIILAARPSMGKTAFALNVATNCAIRANHPVAIYSLEMSKAQLVFRMLCAEAEVSATRARSGRLHPNDFKPLIDACSVLANAPIYIDDTPGQTAMEVRSKARRLKAKHDIDLVIIDYLQLMNSSSLNRQESREQQISSISRSLKALARELNVPVIALSQLNRSVEQRSDKRPMLSDLRESGAIEQDADIVMFIHRDASPEEAMNMEVDQRKLIVAKQRNGPVGDVDLVFRKEFTKFGSFSPMEGYEGLSDGFSNY